MIPSRPLHPRFTRRFKDGSAHTLLIFDRVSADVTTVACWRLRSGGGLSLALSDARCDTPLTFLPRRTQGPGSINTGLPGVRLALMWRWDHSPYQISVIFLRLTRLSTSQRYEPIKGVFHTATTRTSVLISPAPNVQSQAGQGQDCYIW